MNVLVIINLNLAKIVDTISNFFSSILHKLVEVNCFQIIQLVKIMDIVKVLELKGTQTLLIPYFNVLWSLFQTYLVKLFRK